MSKCCDRIKEVLLIGLCVLLLTGLWARGRQERLAGQVLRLHVIARSDDREDQATKLRVRDAVLAELGPLLRQAGSMEEARRITAARLPALEALAERVSGGEARAELGREHYPTRSYDGFSLPAGKYESLRVTLGEGEGRNWWCVVYPLLCSHGRETARETAALTEDDIRLITQDGTDCVLKFRVIEWWDALTAGE